MSDAVPPLPSMWERFKIGAKGFFSHALGYFPRGIALTGLIFAGSAILESMTSVGGAPGFGLGVAGWTNEMLMNRGLAHLAFGSVISGVLGAGSGVHSACKCASGQVAAPAVPGTSTNLTGHGQDIAKSITETCMTAATEHIFTGHGLATAAKAATKLGM